MSNKGIKEDIEYNEEEHEYSEMGNYLKENFNLDDFLDFDKTRDILVINNRWNVEKNLDSIINDFYKGEIDYNKTDNASMFANELNYKNLGIFQALVYTNLKPKYNLEIFYTNPEYAKEMVESLEDRILEKQQERLENIRKKYLNTDNANKKFNWSTKTYKK
tara:strand:+ start:33 stop:518 length:486 start_codon:yes stop_codon:yes gene_type:complete